MKIEYCKDLQRQKEKIKTKLIWFVKFYLILLAVIGSLNFIEYFSK